MLQVGHIEHFNPIMGFLEKNVRQPRFIRTERLAPLAPVRLSDSKPLKIIVPGPGNIRRRNLETYFHSYGVEVDAMLEMDAMIGTLEFVARSDWVTVLPSLIAVNDMASGGIVVNPLADPPMHAEFVLIQPTRRTLSAQARLFLERFEAEVAHIHAAWDAATAAAGRGAARGRRNGGDARRARPAAAARS